VQTDFQVFKVQPNIKLCTFFCIAQQLWCCWCCLLLQTGHSHMALLVQHPGAKSTTGKRRTSSSHRSLSGNSTRRSSSDSDGSSSDAEAHGSFSSSSSRRSSFSGSEGSESPRSPSKAGRMASSLLQCLGSKRFTHGGSKKFTLHDDVAAESAADGTHADVPSSQQQQQQAADASRDAAAPAAAAAAASGDQVVIELGPLAAAAAPAAAAGTAAAAAGPAAPSSPPHWKIPAKPGQITAAAAGAANALDTGLSNPDSSSKQPPAAAGKDAAADDDGAAAGADAAGAKDVLAKTSVGAALQRSSVFGMTGAVPVGIITLEDVLEELMQVGSGFGGFTGSNLGCGSSGFSLCLLASSH
jgi:hypothetical protein